MLRDYVKLIRPHQWIKSSFVFIGVIFGHHWFEWLYVQRAIQAAIAFSLVASGVYILNDIRDRDQDREHPRKKLRPLASGRISVSVGWMLCLLLLSIGLSLGAWLSWLVLLFLLVYLVLNVAYSYGLKHVVILDVFIISTGFMLRILSGTSGIHVEPSKWLLFCGLMITLFLGFSKRRAELLVQAGNSQEQQSRRVLEHYNPALLDLFIGISLACVIMSYSLYTVSADTIAKHGTADLIYTIPFVLYACFRYMYLIHMRGGGEDTARDLVRDPHIILAILAWAVLTVALMFGSPAGSLDQGGLHKPANTKELPQ
ncbi:MAG: decaprenyl-phosphate phosphoribosyltransferase [Leptospiraceae bacterium]|nr:decaprenyl-phosphate phosphoribosyltransferase [Leptospiraceae bacterium]